MGHRSIVLLFSALLALASPGVFALGLGKIKLESALNQPLRAEIELLEVRDLTEREILVGLASQEDFERIGVDRSYFLTDIKFQVVVNRSGSSKVIITSSKPVREPYLNFVVEAHWPSGKLLREYTLLMDLPVFDGGSASSVQTTTTTPSRPSQTTTTQTRDSEYNPRSSFTQDEGSARPRAATQEPVAPSYTGDSYEVRSNDTLWEIATRVRPSRDVSIQQTMLAIQRSNPEAFINNNINLLKKGQILRIPDADEMASAYSRQSAVKEVAAQNAQWSDSYSGAQLSGGRTYDDDTSSSDSPEGRVKLSSPDDAYSSSQGRGAGGSAAASTEALENELAITMEQLDKSSRENEELRTKVQSLEEQIETMEKMIEVSNEKMAALELQSIKNQQEAEAAGETIQSTPESQIEDLYRESQQQGEEEPLFNEETETGAAAAQPEVTPIQTPEATPAPTATPEQQRPVPTPIPEKGVMDLIMDNVAYIVAGIVVLGLIGFVFLRRRAGDEDEFDEFLRQGTEDTSDDTVIQHRDRGAVDEEDDIDLGHFDEPEPEPEEEPEEEPQEEEEADLEAETEDVVAEADIYIAYGKYDQVEEMLLKALDRDSSDENVRLKLLEVFSLQHDIDKFDEHYKVLRTTGASHGVLERAERFRENIPNAPEFDDNSLDLAATNKYTDDFGSTFGEDSSEPDDISLDLDLGDLDSDGETDDGLGLDLPDDSDSDDSLDLDLDFGEDETSVTNEDDLALDLDLDDDDRMDTSDGGLDLDLDFDETSTSDDDLDLDFDSEIADEESSDDLDLGEFDLEIEDDNDEKVTNVSRANLNLTDDLASMDESISLGFDESDSDELAFETSTEDSADSLDLGDDDDLDLSSLDKELDALTSDMEDLDDLGVFDEEPSKPSMEEPETDFGDFDEEPGQSTASASDDSLYDEAVSEVPQEDFELPDIDANDEDGDLDFLSDSDETGTKLDLARAYIDMGDQEGARDIIKEILSEGNDQQKAEAQGLLARIEA